MRSLKNAVRGVLRHLGVEPADVVRSLHGLPPVRAFNNRRTARRLADSAWRHKSLASIIAAQNPAIEQTKRPGVLRIGTIWEGSGRLAWLDHANTDPNCELVHLPRALVNPAWRLFLAGYIAQSRDEMRLGEYALERYFHPERRDGRGKFRDYCRVLMTEITQLYGLDCLIMPKLSDDWTIDFINAVRPTGLPIVVDDREGTVSPKRLETVPPHLRALMDVDFDLLLTHNEIQRTLFQRSGLPADKILINGSPQSDYWHRPDIWQSRCEIDPQLREDRFQILFFSFGPRTYLNFYYGDESRDWTPLCRDYHEVILDLLRRHGDRVQIVYKSGGKPLRDLFAGYADFRSRAKRYITPDNFIELDGTYNSLDLVRVADLVLGFQTAGMLEAMFTDNPIVYGAWGDFYDDIRDSLLPLNRDDALIHAKSKDTLATAINGLIESPSGFNCDTATRDARASLREQYFARADGRVSQRLLDHAKRIARPHHQFSSVAGSDRTVLTVGG